MSDLPFGVVQVLDWNGLFLLAADLCPERALGSCLCREEDVTVEVKGARRGGHTHVPVVKVDPHGARRWVVIGGVEVACGVDDEGRV